MEFFRPDSLKFTDENNMKAKKSRGVPHVVKFEDVQFVVDSLKDLVSDNQNHVLVLDILTIHEFALTILEDSKTCEDFSVNTTT